MTDIDRRLLRRAIELSRINLERQEGGPFGAVIARDGEIVAEGRNLVLASRDPTAHAEIVAIREACRRLGSFQLDGCDIYSSCEPCPMCLGAIYWARPRRLFFASSRLDAATAGFDDSFIYEQIVLPIDRRSIPTTQDLREEARGVFDAWGGEKY
jgi:tRNA(Arg) A34 adenosine deaminase TadA